MLVSDFVVNSTLKILKGISVECMEFLNRDVKKKQEGKWFMYIEGRIITNAKLLDIMHESYGFNAN